MVGFGLCIGFRGSRDVHAPQVHIRCSHVQGGMLTHAQAHCRTYVELPDIFLCTRRCEPDCRRSLPNLEKQKNPKPRAKPSTCGMADLWICERHLPGHHLGRGELFFQCRATAQPKSVVLKGFPGVHHQTHTPDLEVGS